MDLWGTLVNGVETVKNGVVQGASWTWNNASLSRLTVGFVKYTTNTAFGILEQGLALKTAIPALINNPKSLKIVKGMGHMVIDAIPVILLNYANTSVQNYFRSDADKDASWFTGYSVFLSGLTLVNYGVRAYTIRQSVQSVIRISVLDTLGPVAFKVKQPNAEAKMPSLSLCEKEQCTTSRKLKGLLREPVILLSNDLLTGALSTFVSETVSDVVRVGFNGRHIARMAIPGLCERHKIQDVMQESMWSLGLTYELSSILMDKFFEATVGMPPYLYYRTLRHLLLLLHVNMACHMRLSLIDPKEATLPFDPLNLFEGIVRFSTDVVSAGLLKIVPLVFKFDENAEPFIPLPLALKYGVGLLEHDIEKRDALASKLHVQILNKSCFILPPVLQSVNGFLRDPIINLYWPGFNKRLTLYVDYAKTARSVINQYSLDKYPKLVTFGLRHYYKVPTDVTEIALTLNGEEDFWNLIFALKAWLDRHCEKRVSVIPKLPEPIIALHQNTGDEPQEFVTSDKLTVAIDELLPSKTVPKQSIQSGELTGDTKQPELINTKKLMPKKPEHIEIKRIDFQPKKRQPTIVSTNSASLFNRSRLNKTEEVETISLLKKTS